MSETECQILERSECRVSGGTWKGGSSCTEETCKPREIAPPPPPLPPSGPSRYAGPDLVMVWGSDAVFKQNDDLIVIPRGQVLEEIEVVAIDAPRTVTVHWRGGGPFELDLFPADELPSANETVTDTLLEGRSRPHVEDNRPTRGASGAHTP